MSQENDVEEELTEGPSAARKVLGVFLGTGMNINNIIGSGIVTTPGIIWKKVKSPEVVLLLWLIGGVISMAGSLSYVELGTMHKISGGETIYLRSAYPKPRLMMSYLFSFMFIFAIRPGIICAILQSAAQYLWYTIHYDQDDQDGQCDDNSDRCKNGWHLQFSPFWSIKFIAVFMLFVITLYHMYSTKMASYINHILAVMKLFTYSIIAGMGLYRLIVDRSNWQKLEDPEDATNLTAYSTAILLIMFSYDGWNNLNYSLDEFKRVERKLVFSNGVSVAIVTVLYILINVAFISVIPEEILLNEKHTDETTAAIFFRQLFFSVNHEHNDLIGEKNSQILVKIFTSLTVLSILGTAASSVWSGSRVIEKAAFLGYFPKCLDKLALRNEDSTPFGADSTPFNALLAQFIWCTLIILILGSSFTITSFVLLSSFAMYSYWIFYLATGIGLLVLRRKKPRAKRPFKVWLPMVALFIFAGLCILIFSFVDVLFLKIPKVQKVEKIAPFIISYGFLLIAFMFYLKFTYTCTARIR